MTTVPSRPAGDGVMRVLVAGAGGVGGYFGARLARAGVGVTFLARGAHLEALRRHGLRVRSTVDGEDVVAVEAVDRVVAGPPADVVLLCVKSFDTEAALEQVRPAVGPTTAVLSLQNGVESVDTIERVLGPGHAVGGAAYVFATIAGPGVIDHRFGGRIVLGEVDGRVTPRAEAIRDAFVRAGVPVELSAEIRRALWEKYVLISAQAGVTALTRCPMGVIRTVPETWRLYRLIVDELVAVAGAADVRLPPDTADRVMAIAAGVDSEATSSLFHDLTHGRRLELETLHGHAVRLAERLRVPVPAVFAVYAALKPHAGGRSA
jgi:2-dehydropantoate 2-reductase